MDDLAEVLLAAPSVTTTATGHNNDLVDELARTLSRLLLPLSFAEDLGVVIKDYLLPCLDTYSECTLPVVHPDLHTILSTPAYFAGRSIHAGFYEINKLSISTRAGQSVPRLPSAPRPASPPSWPFPRSPAPEPSTSTRPT